MHTSFSLVVQPSSPEDSGFDAWRQLARTALQSATPPDEIDFQDARSAANLHLDLSAPAVSPAPTASNATPHVPRAFLDAAAIVACHRDDTRWNLLYRLLWRLQADKNLLHLATDEDVARLRSLEHQVRHDLHKMDAFVRFRRIEDTAGEVFVAWHQPLHRIVKLATPFFAERFSIMRWTILTPDASVSWSPATRQASFGPGVSYDQAPQADDLEDLWRSYYASIFNPARVNPTLMRSHMPVSYWKSLPEIDLLPGLLATAESRVGSMVESQSAVASARPFIPTDATLPVIRQSLPACHGCDLYRHATQVVAGKGNASATLMLIGEQPGDQEDLRGEPFVGPAGDVLRKALAENGIDPSTIYMTNAVKHFKFVQRGKLRIHQNPRMTEINACRPWLEAEIDALKPQVILCVGASAAKAVLGGTFALMRDRGRFVETRYSANTIATVHPSAVLRARDKQKAEDLYGLLRLDLSVAYQQAVGGGNAHGRLSPQKALSSPDPFKTSILR